MKELDNLDFKFHGGDYGLFYEGQCPDCRDMVQIAKLSDGKCECGYTWKLEIKGYTEDNQGE